MKKAFLFAMSLALVFTSCSSDDNSSNNLLPSTGTKLIKIIETFDDGSTSTIDFFYNGNKIVKYVYDYGEENHFTYSGNLITGENSIFEDPDNPGALLEEIYDYEYDSNDRLVKSTFTDELGNVGVDNFTYNSNGTISFVTTSGGNTIANGTIYLNGDQPYKKEVTLDPGTIDEYSWVEENFFDNKVNPFNSITGLSKLEIACPTYFRGYQGIMNNVTELKYNDVSEWSSVYTYNSNNMPATEIYTEPSDPDLNSTNQYIYN